MPSTRTKPTLTNDEKELIDTTISQYEDKFGDQASPYSVEKFIRSYYPGRGKRLGLSTIKRYMSETREGETTTHEQTNGGTS